MTPSLIATWYDQSGAGMARTRYAASAYRFAVVSAISGSSAIARLLCLDLLTGLRTTSVLRYILRRRVITRAPQEPCDSRQLKINLDVTQSAKLYELMALDICARARSLAEGKAPFSNFFNFSQTRVRRIVIDDSLA